MAYTIIAKCAEILIYNRAPTAAAAQARAHERRGAGASEVRVFETRPPRGPNGIAEEVFVSAADLAARAAGEGASAAKGTVIKVGGEPPATEASAGRPDRSGHVRVFRAGRGEEG